MREYAPEEIMPPEKRFGIEHMAWLNEEPSLVPVKFRSFRVAM